MSDHIPIARECILTAFSLTPTEDLLAELKDLAQKSGFVEDISALGSQAEGGDDVPSSLEHPTNFQDLDFDKEIDSFITSLEEGRFMRTSYSGRLKDKKKNRNLDALLTIQGMHVQCRILYH